MTLNSTDAVDLDRLRRHDETVLPSLLGRFGGDLAAVVRGTWAGVADVEVDEVVADVVADAWFRGDEIDLARGSLTAWLRMRARFRTLDRLRRARRERRLFARLVRLDFGRSSTPEFPSDLDAYLADLGTLDRRIAVLRFVEGRPVAEVAERCGITEKAAEHRVARLRQHLRSRITAAPEREVPSHG
jgi:RNA polymerase sigma factor (sigma-70 family)